MLKHSNIPETAVPTDLENENAIRVNYKTNLLLPSLGPLMAARYLGWFENLFLDFVFTRDILEALKAYYVTYNTIPQLQSDKSDNPLVLYPAVSSQKMMRKDLLDQLIIEHEQSINTDIKKHMQANPKLSTSGNIFLNEVKSYGMIKKYKINVPGLSAEIQNAIKQKLHALNILNMLQRKNEIIQDLFIIGIFKEKGDVISADILSKEPNFILLAELLKPKATLTRTIDNIEGAESLIKRSLQNTDTIKNITLSQLYIDNDQFAENLNNYLIWKLEAILKNNPDAMIVGLLKSADDLNKNREWAFQRYEELRLALEKPFFRGPVSANSVAPHSSLKITETTMQTSEEENVVKEYSGKSSISSSQFQQALDNMAYYGISKMRYSTETVLSTMKEERRSIVENVSKEISKNNETTHITRITDNTGRSTEYTTLGKDTKLATTELGYQVVVPAKASIRLRGIGLVWCPRVRSPFLQLYNNIEKYAEEQYNEYLKQNYTVPIEIEPLKAYEPYRVEPHDEEINGTEEIQVKDFEFSFEISDAEERVFKTDVDCQFFNTGNDYLEDWSESVRNVVIMETAPENGATCRKITVSGRVVLQTEDPEWFWNANEGKITVYATVSKLTADSKEKIANAKENYALQKAAAESRARQYSVMKRDELIESYQDQIKLRSEAFSALIRRTFKSLQLRPHRSYYREVLSRCIDWSASHMIFESQPMNCLIFRHLAPDHFMNCPAIRFFLVIRPEAEDIFFDTLKKGAGKFYEKHAKSIRYHINKLSSQVRKWVDTNDEKLKLDEFYTDIIIGRHLEAVLSRFEFSS